MDGEPLVESVQVRRGGPGSFRIERDAGGDLAVEGDGEWTGSLSSPESVAGLERAQTLFEQASGAPKDGNEADPQVPFCNNEIGMLSAPGWVAGLIDSADTGCPGMMKNVGVFALPGSNGAVKDGWDGTLAEQLDSRNRPCNFVELMPRLREK